MNTCHYQYNDYTSVQQQEWYEPNKKQVWVIAITYHYYYNICLTAFSPGQPG